jgi:DNA-binding XRE family transcriptional regulator
VAKRLRLIRRAYNALLAPAPPISQAEFARRCGIAPQAWNNAEVGRARIGLDGAIKLCRLTGATLDFVFLDSPAALPRVLAAKIARLRRSRKS